MNGFFLFVTRHSCKATGRCGQVDVPKDLISSRRRLPAKLFLLSPKFCPGRQFFSFRPKYYCGYQNSQSQDRAELGK